MENDGGKNCQNLLELFYFIASLELTCCDHQVEPHGQCSEWVGLRLASSSLGERWPGLGCIPGGEKESEPGRENRQRRTLSCLSPKVPDSYLKGGPVHMHPGSVVVAEPLQILLCVCSQDCALQFSVYCGIAEERKVEQTVRMREPEQTSCVCWGGGGYPQDSGFRMIQSRLTKTPVSPCVLSPQQHNNVAKTVLKILPHILDDVVVNQQHP